jgi:RimJ/RimL family protein N-acetyltransferase
MTAMSNGMRLRLATVADSELLLQWRNDPTTRGASHNSAHIALAEHRAWLEKTLRNPERRLYIAEEDGMPVGTARADLADGVWELSWTVAPTARGRGVGKRMVALLAQQIREPIRAEVKAGNTASARIAEQAGMTFDLEADGVLHFSRAGLR